MTTVHPAVGEYLTGLRAALADLPAAEVDEIVDDARGHLTDLSAEMGPDAGRAGLEERLGSPAAYADELRAAAGYPAPPAPTAPGRGRARLALGLLVAATVIVSVAGLGRSIPVLVFGLAIAAVGLALVAGEGSGIRSVGELPLVARVRAARPSPGTPTGVVLGFLGSLQPAWWLLRAGAVAVVATLWLGFPGVAVAVVVLVGAPLSVWIGYLSRADRRWWWAVVPLNALAAVMLFVGAVLVAGLAVQGRPTADMYSSPGLTQDGRTVQDVRPFDAFGNPLSNVYLFDQNGRPLDTDATSECTPPSGSSAYPRGTARFDPNTGACTVVPPAPLAVAIPTLTPTAQPTPTGPSAAVPTSASRPTTAAAPTSTPR